MKIVVVTQNCFPYISPRSNRATELAKEFVRQGHDVTLYALLGDVDYFDFCENTGVKVSRNMVCWIMVIDETIIRSISLSHVIWGTILIFQR